MFEKKPKLKKASNNNEDLLPEPYTNKFTSSKKLTTSKFNNELVLY